MSLKIDLHTHILRQQWPDLAQRYGYDGFVTIEHHALLCQTLERWKILPKSMTVLGLNADSGSDQQGVDVQALSTVPIMFTTAKAKDAHDLLKLLNDCIAEVVKDHPKRFVGLGTVPLQDPEPGLLEMDRCIDE